jgi:carbon storage regulator CsrA
MLVLSRRPNERVLLPGLDVAVQVLSLKPGVVRLGVEAPEGVAIFREEVWRRLGQTATDAHSPPTPAVERALAELNHMLRNRLNVTSIGMALLRRQLEERLAQEAHVTIDKLTQDLEMLQERVEASFEALRPRRARSAKALVVEDDRNECELLAGFLRMAGVEVTTAGDGADALDHLRQRGRPDFVLLDMLLPRCDGASMVRALRRDPAYTDLKIFALTGRAPEEFNLDSGTARIDRWFRKPINPEVLLRDLHQELGI